MSLSNPLVGVRFPIPFDEIRAEHVKPAFALLLNEAKARIDAIADTPGERSYENTLAALDDASERLDFAVSITRHLEAVVTSPELREAWDAVQPEVAAFYSSIPLHAGLWNALKVFAETPEAKKLEGVRERFLTKSLENFRRQGADLDAAGKKRMNEIDVELAAVTLKFTQNVVDATAGFEYWVEDEKGLAGLPPSAVAAARQSAEAKGRAGWRFTLQGPSYTAVMTYLDDAAVRKLFYEAYNQRAAEENAPLIAKVLELRREKARLLGYKDFADFVLADRMAKNGAAAQKFERDLSAKTEQAFRRENADLQGFRRNAAPGEIPMEPWDVAYWAEKQRAAMYAFEEEDLRPYFPEERVISGLFELVKRLFGVSVVEAGPAPTWHPEVKFYEMRDADGTLIASFYADWFPRDTKRGGAWMDSFYTGRTETGRWQPHVGLMCGNLTPPLPDRPALLTHREVETIFHEFGHLLHHSLSKVEVRSLAGTSVAWDFVELPSQIMENWCWERGSLDLFARHWQSGEPIPEELFQKMRAARTFRAANAQMRQLGFGTTDLALHIDYDHERDGDAVEYANGILAVYAPAPLPPGYAMLASFTHLFGDPVGYGAAYYSYKWAEVLDADAFTRFQQEGFFSREAGLAFRTCILEKGDSEDPAELFRRFLGRDPSPEALLKRLGLE